MNAHTCAIGMCYRNTYNGAIGMYYKNAHTGAVGMPILELSPQVGPSGLCNCTSVIRLLLGCLYTYSNTDVHGPICGKCPVCVVDTVIQIQ